MQEHVHEHCGRWHKEKEGKEEGTLSTLAVE